MHLRDISESGASYSIAVDAAWLSTALEGTDYAASQDPAGKFSVDLTMSGDDVVLRGAGSVAVRAQCVRCLESLTLSVASEFSLLLEPAGATHRPAGVTNAEDEYEIGADEPDRDVYHDDTIDVGSWVREQILIELPTHPAHESCSPPALPKTETKAKDLRLAGLEKIKLKE